MRFVKFCLDVFAALDMLERLCNNIHMNKKEAPESLKRSEGRETTRNRRRSQVALSATCILSAFDLKGKVEDERTTEGKEAGRDCRSR